MKSYIAVFAGFVAGCVGGRCGESAAGAGNLTLGPASCAGFSDCLLIYDKGQLTDYSIFVTEAQEAANGAQYIYTSSVAVDTSQFGNATVFIEPGVPVSSGYSDIVGVAQINGSYYLGFASDTRDAARELWLVPSIPFPSLWVRTT